MKEDKIKFRLYLITSIANFITAGIYVYLVISTGINNYLISAALFTLCFIFSTVLAAKCRKAAKQNGE